MSIETRTPKDNTVKSEEKEVNQTLREAKMLAVDLCDDCSQNCRNRLIIFDSQIEAHRKLMGELQQKLATLEQALDQFRGLYRINMKLINLINSQEKNGHVTK